MADRRKQLSGSQLRERKAQKDKEQTKQEGSFLKYLRPSQASLRQRVEDTEEGCSAQTITDAEAVDLEPEVFDCHDDDDGESHETVETTQEQKDQECGNTTLFVTATQRQLQV